MGAFGAFTARLLLICVILDLQDVIVGHFQPFYILNEYWSKKGRLINNKSHYLHS